MGDGAKVKLLDLGDALALVGLLLLAVGLWLIYAPAAFIVVGVMLLALSLLRALRSG